METRLRQRVRPRHAVEAIENRKRAREGRAVDVQHGTRLGRCVALMVDSDAQAIDGSEDTGGRMHGSPILRAGHHGIKR
jgi:hypothetical protein